MKKQLLTKTVLILTLVILLPIVGCASGGKGRPQGPPPEAIAACEGKSVGDSVTFTGREGESIKSTCQEVDGQIVAVPEDMPKGGPPRS
ncbi:hypothetical protein SAMN05660420_00515 [Desulfuromusa kysingii]|uniref:Uncharacterized protein n=2 Tax=Desulfuromusa kysingii TaxID=37625 RepID=A0A1H3W7L2_9BACT|nr:hypothetical protein SAMN05660420_00515 [Desulfuromusa kysingii]